MSGSVTETFFLPEPTGSDATRIPADIYYLSHILLARSEFNCVFVPVRSCQYLGVITIDEILFVDSLAYAHQQGQGGRIIMLAWKFDHHAEREALTSPVDCEVIYYHEKSRDMHRRLIGDFREAIAQVDELYREQELPANGAKIIPID